MAINAGYYGPETSWIDFKPVAGMTDDFKVASFSTAVADLGYSARTWLATKCGMNYEDYKKPLDLSFCWCGTDGTAPFDNVFGVTGYNNNHDRYQVNQNGKSSIGLGTKGNDTSYIDEVFCQYFKVSAGGGAAWGNVPLNFQPKYAFAPTTDSYTGGLKVVRLSNGGLTPALKFNFNNYYLVPFVHYYVLKSTATLTDWGNVTDPTNYSTLVDATKRDDLYTFCKRIEDQTYSADKIVIFAITGLINHVAWQNDKSYNVGDVSFGTRTATSGLLQGFAVNENTADLEFDDWYDTSERQKTYKIKIDTSLINNRGYAIGDCGIYNGKIGQITTGDYDTRNSVVLAGCPPTTGVGYYSGVTGAPYTYESFSRDVSKFHVKNFSADSSLPNARRYAYNFTATIGDFTDLNGFREYVRKACAYYGMYFTEMMYPNTTQDWLTEDAFIGTIDSSGITHGAYTHGADNANQPQRNWGDNWASKTPYKPGGNVNPKPPKDPHEDLNPVTSTGLGFTTAYGNGSLCYALNDGDFQEIWSDIYEMSDSKWGDMLEKLALFGSNPMNAFLSYRWYPCSWNPPDQANVVLGSTIVNSQHLYPIFKTVSQCSYHNSGSYWLAEEGDYGDNNFYNLNHLTVCLWLPFYGFYELPATKCISEEVSAELYIDVPADTAQWIISFGGSIYDFLECTPYVDIPFTGDNSIQIATAKRNNMIQNSIAIGAGVVLTALGVGAVAPAISEAIAAGAATAGITGGSLLGGIISNIGPLIGDQAINLAAAGAGLASIGKGVSNIAQLGQSISQQANQIGSLKTSVPTHAGSDSTTFLHLPLKPIIFWWRPNLFETFDKAEYMRTVGIATEQWSTIDSMPDNSLLSISNPTYDTSGMTEFEIQSLNNALAGFIK